jgi:hypothetical protein
MTDKETLKLAHGYLDRLIKGLNMDDTSEAVQVRDAIKQARSAHIEENLEMVAAPVQEPVAWRYTDSRGHYRYRGYVPGFDAEYQLLKPKALCLCAATPPAAPVQEPVETADTLFRQFMSEANKAGITHWPTPPAAPVQEPVISNVGADANMLWPDKPFVPKGTGKITLHESKPN